MRYDVLARDEIAPGEMRRVQVGPVAVVLVCDHLGQFYALRDECPHQSVALSSGEAEPLIDSSETGQYVVTDKSVLRCPRHGYEFELESGRCPADRRRYGVKTYQVIVENGRIMIER